MDREQTKNYIKEQLETYLQGKGINTNKPFHCINPAHADTNPSMSIDRSKGQPYHAKCFSCGAYYDTFDIIGIDYNLTDSKDIFSKAHEVFNITAEKDLKEIFTNHPQMDNSIHINANTQQTDYTDYFLQAHSRIHETDYPQRRGLSETVINRFKLGYDPQWVSPAAAAQGYNYPSPRLIIPISRYGYLARDTREEIPAASQGYKKMKTGKLSTFNAAALRNADRPVFVTEGEINAMSIIEAGGEAVAIGTTARAETFIAEAAQSRPKQPLIIAMDNDEAGEKAAEKIRAGLTKHNIPFIDCSITGGNKDANEALTADRDKFTEAVQAATKQAIEKGRENIDILFKGESITEQPGADDQRIKPTAENPQPDNIAEYLERTFTDDLKHFEAFKDKKTGFDNLDEHTGGLYPGLYVIGAISSLGKTTFVHQMADQLAAAGDHILFFSLEQNRLEMVTKSLSRITARHDPGTAVSAIKIRGGGISNPAVIAAAEEYSNIAKRVSVIECNFNENIMSILDYIEKYMSCNPGVKPVVIVDYLQIIPASDTRQDTRTKVDTIVRGLKKIQSDNSLVVFVVSSINRSNYLYPIDFESFKESGGIEYTADVVWGLQLQILNDPVFESESKIKDKREKVRTAKAATPRKMELICLKNRYGISSYKCGFDYYPKFDLFKEDNTYTENSTGQQSNTGTVSQPKNQGYRTKGKGKGSARNPEVVKDAELVQIN